MSRDDLASGPVVLDDDSQVPELIDQRAVPPSSQTPGFGRAVRWNVIGSVFRAIMTIASQMALVRLLGPVIAGQFAIFMVVVGIGLILSEGGILGALVRAPEMTRDVLRNALFLVLAYSTAVTAVMFAGNGLLAALFALPPSERFIPLAATANIIPLALSAVPMAILKRQYRAKELQLIQIGSYFIGFLCIGVPVALFHPSVVAMILAYSVQTILILVAAWATTRCPMLPLVRGAAAIRANSLKGLSVNILYFFNEAIANVLTARTLGTRDVGLYGTSANLGRNPTDMLINMLHAPLMVSTANDSREGGARFLETLNIIACLAVPAYLFVFLCSDTILIPLLGPKWTDATPVFGVLALAMLVRLTGMLSGAVVWGLGKLMTDFVAHLTALLVFIGLFVLLRPGDARHVGMLVLAAWSLRTAVQVAAAARGCALPAQRIVSAFVLPSLFSTLLMLPVWWVHQRLGAGAGLVGLVELAMVAGAGFAVLMAAVIVRPGFAWQRAIAGRLSGLKHRATLRAA